MASQADLVGRWDIVSWEQEFDDGRVTRPMGDDLEGFIRYTDDGDMSCVINQGDRPRFTTGGQWDAHDAELARAYRSMLVYAGRYEFDGTTVVHYVQQSLYPNWTGGQQRRRVEFQPDGTVVLEARLEENTAQARTARLVWRRHRASGAEGESR